MAEGLSGGLQIHIRGFDSLYHLQKRKNMARIVNPTVKKTISDKNNIIPIRSISWVSKRIVDHSDAEDPVFFLKSTWEPRVFL